MVERGSAPTVLQHPPLVAYGVNAENCRVSLGILAPERFGSATEQLTQQIEKEATITARKLTYSEQSTGKAEQDQPKPSMAEMLKGNRSVQQVVLQTKEPKKKSKQVWRAKQADNQLESNAQISQETLQLRRKGKNIAITSEE
ncbi:hypothetical protein HAX54_026172, partial [Datura stramonium]|nr:hypothetical protein [Datura stramonium]